MEQDQPSPQKVKRRNLIVRVLSSSVGIALGLRLQSTRAEDAMVSPAQALAIAHEWIDTWNSGDLEKNLALYADDCEMVSPLVPQIAHEPSGILKGKATVGAYFRRLWESAPNVRLELLTACAGVNSLALHYKGAGGRIVIEVLSLRPDGKILRAHAHYPIPASAVQDR